MGVHLSGLVEKQPLTFERLSGSTIAIDAYNTIYQFLSIIRQPDGNPLTNSKGAVTSHLSGLFYRTGRLIDVGIRPVYVFDGKPPDLKRKTLQQREQVRETAREKWKEALEKEDLERARTYAQATSRLTKEMVNDCKLLLTAMGVAVFQAPSEGEAQAAQFALNGDVDYCASQDYDSLLFGAPRLIKNLTITGRRKLPRKNQYVEVVPELLELKKALGDLGITRQQLIWIAILVGTDFNQGVHGIGPKKALKLVKECKSLEEVVRESKGEFEVDPAEVEQIFLNPNISHDKIVYPKANKEDVFKILVDENDFDRGRVESALGKMIENIEEKGAQSKLSSWFGH
ncbi:Flap endonuclease 1 [Candidatus Gugararchaeum adminiculabundum]|nr:Flap endonuclease 1 [Candidatus Gugararchaeum adminiculabundum]